MAEPFKVCPRCQLQAPLVATVCARCGHQFRTTFGPPPPIDQTQVVYPPAPQPPLNSGVDLTRPMDVQRMPSVYTPPPGAPIPPPMQQQTYAGLSSPYGPLRNPYGQVYAQPPISMDLPKNHTVAIVLAYCCLAVEFSARFIFPGLGAGAIAVLAWFGSLGLGIYLVAQDEKIAKVNGWVVLGIKGAQLVLFVVVLIWVMSMASRAMESIGGRRYGSSPYGNSSTGSTPSAPQGWPSVTR